MVMYVRLKIASPIPMVHCVVLDDMRVYVGLQLHHLQWKHWAQLSWASRTQSTLISRALQNAVDNDDGKSQLL